MASDLENLQTLKSNALAALAAMTIRPDYSIDGQAVQWDKHRQSLLDEVARIDGLIAAANGPWEILS